MVITVTLNPAMDKTLAIDNFSLGEVNRSSKVRHDIGGKGINVSKVLRNFGVASVCTGFLGGIWEKYFLEELNTRSINTNFISIKGATRTNTKIVDHLNRTYTDINEAGPEVSEEELNSFIENFRELCKAGDIVVLSGGVSPVIPKDIYGKLIKIAKEKGASTILDAEGELLEEGIAQKPNIIKPNIHELEKLMGEKYKSEYEVIKAGRILVNQGIDKVLISLGDKGALLVTKDAAYNCKGLKVPVKSTVGAGDSMVAALVFSLLNGFNQGDTLKFANACGAASVSIEGTEACTLEQVNSLLELIEVSIKEEF